MKTFMRIILGLAFVLGACAERESTEIRPRGPGRTDRPGTNKPGGNGGTNRATFSVRASFVHFIEMQNQLKWLRLAIVAPDEFGHCPALTKNTESKEGSHLTANVTLTWENCRSGSSSRRGHLAYTLTLKNDPQKKNFIEKGLFDNLHIISKELEGFPANTFLITSYSNPRKELAFSQSIRLNQITENRYHFTHLFNYEPEVTKKTTDHEIQEDWEVSGGGDLYLELNDEGHYTLGISGINVNTAYNKVVTKDSRLNSEDSVLTLTAEDDVKLRFSSCGYPLGRLKSNFTHSSAPKETAKNEITLTEREIRFKGLEYKEQWPDCRGLRDLFVHNLFRSIADY